MRAETWMNQTPPPKTDPVQQARNDIAHWEKRCRFYSDGLADAQKQFVNAVERLKEVKP